MEHEPVVERFLRYVGVSSQSRESVPDSDIAPTSPGQMELARMLKNELEELFRKNNVQAQIDLRSNALLVCLIPATEGFEKAPVLWLSAHLDTYETGSPDIRPQFHDYESGDITLAPGVVITAKELQMFEHETIITSDGTSVLGADDKAGLAGIMEAIELTHGFSIEHGEIILVFFPDEELGRFKAKQLPSDLLEKKGIFLTVDGCAMGEVDIGCYSGRKVTVTFEGRDAHPGPDGHKIASAIYAATSFVELLAKKPAPWNKDADGGYVFSTAIQGSTEKCVVTCIPRAFKDNDSLKKVEELEALAETATRIWPGTKFSCEVEHTYTSTKDAIDANPWCLEPITKAIEKTTGKKPILQEVPAGTDGAMLNLVFPSIPSPNIGTGAHNIHQLTEFICAEDLCTLQQILCDIIGNVARIT